MQKNEQTKMGNALALGRFSITSCMSFVFIRPSFPAAAVAERIKVVIENLPCCFMPYDSSIYALPLKGNVYGSSMCK
jgi:hypothetical protein